MKEESFPIQFVTKEAGEKCEGLLSLQAEGRGFYVFYILSNSKVLDGNGAPNKFGYKYSWQVCCTFKEEEKKEIFLKWFKNQNENTPDFLFDWPSYKVKNICFKRTIHFKEIEL